MFHTLNRRAAVAVGAAVTATAAAAALAVATPADATAHSSSLAAVCKAADAHHTSVVFVHGAFAETSSWQGEVDALTHAGCHARAIANPLRDLTTDARTVADFAAAQPGKVLLVGHSYGGSVISNAAAQAKNVVGLVFVDAAAPAVGETTAQLSGKDSYLSTHAPATLFDTVPYAGAPAGAKDQYLKESVFVHHFAQDLPRAQAESLWATQRAASTAALGTPAKYAAWRTLPSWYFISTGDQIITPSSELAQAKRAHSHVTLFHGGSHLTLISHPGAVTAVVAEALTGVDK